MGMVDRIANAFVEGGKLVLLSRSDTGERVARRIAPEYAAFLDLSIEEDIAKPGLIAAIRMDSRILSITQDGKHWRIRFRDWESRKTVCKTFKEVGIPVYEGDVDPVRRYLADIGTQISAPKRLYFDIETDSRFTFTEATEGGMARVLAWSAKDENGGSWASGLEEETDACCAALLTAFWRVAEKYDQLIAWNGEGFDFPVMEKRSEALGVLPAGGLRRWLWLDHMQVFEGMNKNSAESGEEKQSMALQKVAMALLGYGKDDFDASKTYEEWAKGGEAREAMFRYNAKDVQLMLDIEQKTGYLLLFQTVCEACQVLGNTRGLLPTQQMDGFMLRLGSQRDHRFATKFYEKDDVEHKQYRGAFVQHPTQKGIIENVHVCDFASLYPSIIVTWNMSPETKVSGDDACGCCTAPTTGISFSIGEQGILPFAVSELMRLRKHWRDLVPQFAPGTPEAIEAARRSMAYKVIANSFYGVVGSPFARYFDSEVAESITQTGVWLIKATIEAAASPQWGLRTVYGDTDSAFMVGATKERFEAFKNWCNSTLYPGIIEKTGARLDWFRVKLDYEKQYRQIVFGVDDSGNLVAKKYIANLAHYKGKEATADTKPDIKGYEFRRGDWNVLARGLQRRVIEFFAKSQLEMPRFIGAIEEVRSRILHAEIPVDEVKLTKSLGKDLDDYKVRQKKDGGEGAQQPHIALGRRLKAEGKDVRPGTKIDYVVTDGSKSGGIGVILASEYAGEFDRFYMWEKLVYPATMRLCMAIFPDHDWKRYLKVRPAKPRKTSEFSAERFAEKPGETPEAPTVDGSGPGVVLALCDCEECLANRSELVAKLGPILEAHNGDRIVEIVCSDARNIDTEGASVDVSMGLLRKLKALNVNGHEVVRYSQARRIQ